MKLQNIFKLVLVLSLVCVGITSTKEVRAEEVVEARKLIETTIASIKEKIKAEKSKVSVEELDAKLKEIILPVFDFRQMAKLSLGAEWNKINEQQQKEFIDLFSDLLSRTYLKTIRENAEESKITVKSELKKAKMTIIKTEAVTPKDTIVIEYKLYLSGSNYRVFDVVVENVGLVSNYRTQFSEIIKKEKFEGLLSDLKKKNIKS